MMQGIGQGYHGSIAYNNFGLKHRFGKMAAAICVFCHGSSSLIGIRNYCNAGFCAYVEVPQHMTAREGC